MNPQEYIATFKEKSGRLPSQVELSRALNIPADAALKTLIAASRKNGHAPVEQQKKKAKVNLIVVGLFFISSLTFMLSIYFTGLWFLSMFNLWIAGAISVSMVSYMVLSPQAAMYVKGVVKVPLWSTFLIALVFSMGSTIAGQYNKLTEAVNVEEVNERALLAVLRAEEEQLVMSIEEDRAQREFHQRTIEQLSQTAEDRIENSVYIRTERNMIDELGNEIFGNQERLREVRSEIATELQRGTTGATVERADFYAWIASLIGAARAGVEFWVSVLPAVFIDIIAALSLNLAILIKGKNA